ncbi:MAG TPA: hypothetical protein DEQ87_03910 [Algoriphagus sp.]|nr:hypothetical protein [Algoriphagus sp.]HAH36382.1 hypothetical protein [Algoriphagus sp.]HAS59311.1 hypothetical protein [Algoriphagus sp.]HCB45098.1 hypothetical protein [Algoriphagus sp.]HCD86773.1 hypothetical protein [Algoriphagus sp.]
MPPFAYVWNGRHGLRQLLDVIPFSKFNLFRVARSKPTKIYFSTSSADRPIEEGLGLFRS